MNMRLVITCLAFVGIALTLTPVNALPTVRAMHPPGSSIVRTYTNVLPPSLVERLEQECRAIAEYERSQPSLRNSKYATRWFPNGQLPRTAIEEAITRLRKYAAPGGRNIGAEWWVQMVEAGPQGSIGWHVDKDESVASNKHYLLHPELASIFYLTDVGGSTVITEQWSPHGAGYDPLFPTHGYLSRPEKNKYLIFHGELLHGVIPGPVPQPPGTKRLTFLVNWWDVKPEEPNCSPLKYDEVAGLKTMNAQELVQFRKKLDEEVKSLETQNIRPRRQAIPDVELDKASDTSYIYKYTLPGGAQAQARLPKEPYNLESSTLHLLWFKRLHKAKQPPMRDEL